MLSPTEMMETLALDMFVVRPNMSRTSKYKFVVLRKEVVKQEGQSDETKMKCAAQFETEEDAELWAKAKRKQFIAKATNRAQQLTIE